MTRGRAPRAGRWGGATLYDTSVSHARRDPVGHGFRYRGASWLVDLDALPRPPRALAPLAGFRAADHLGDPDLTIRQNVEALLAANGVDLQGGRIRMLAMPRTFGYVFNPLSVFWCHDASGALACVVAEVHNTYGGRHAYLLRPGAPGGPSGPSGPGDDGDTRGTEPVYEAEKAFYVSPFYPVDGHYRLRLPEPGDRLDLRVELHRAGDRPFVATLRGRGRPATTASVLRSAVRAPWAPALVALRIRRQGLRLWARGLPVVPRPVAGATVGMEP